MIRALDPACAAEVEWVAERMRATLIEVLGEERGTSLYTLEWLRERVRWHLDPEQSTGQVFLSESPIGPVNGHAIVRVESDQANGEFGLFSTIYVEPNARGQGVASELLLRGESWLRGQGMTEAATYTASSNRPLIRLFETHGYAVAAEIPEPDMVRLAKALPAPSERRRPNP